LKVPMGLRISQIVLSVAMVFFSACTPRSTPSAAVETPGAASASQLEPTSRPTMETTASVSTSMPQTPSPVLTPTPNQRTTPDTNILPVPTTKPYQGVPVSGTSACAITSPPLNMVGISTHPEVFGTGADPNYITLGPKAGCNPDWPVYDGKVSNEFELQRGAPVLAPIDMVLIGVNNRGAAHKIDDLSLYFESVSPDWPGMIVFVYHLQSSPLVLKDSQTQVEEWGSVLRAQGHLFYPDADYLAPANATSCEAMIGHKVRRGELIGFAGSVGFAGGTGSHSMASFCFKVQDSSMNPTVTKGNRYLHWVQSSSFFYWKSYSPNATFPSGVLAYPFECDGYQLPAEQDDVSFKYTATK
jgi:hypothetical protein